MLHKKIDLYHPFFNDLFDRMEYHLDDLQVFTSEYFDEIIKEINCEVFTSNPFQLKYRLKLVKSFIEMVNPKFELDLKYLREYEQILSRFLTEFI